MRPWPVLAVLTLAACNGGDTTDTDTDTVDTNTGPLTFEDFVNVTTEAVGDFSGHPGGEPWLTQTPDTSLQTVVSTAATVVDFDSGDVVPAANVDFWYADDVSGPIDVSGVTDSTGLVNLDVKVCAPVSYRTWTDPDLDQTRDTYKAHEIIKAGTSPAIDLDSVSTTTYSIIPSILGVPVTAGEGIIAGTAKDKNDEPIENAQVIVRDSAGNIPEGLIVKYFVDKFPNRDQPDTSPDGLWVAINIPEGTYTVEMWTVRGGTLVESGATVVQSYPDSINISNIFAGYGDGVKFPTECLAP